MRRNPRQSHHRTGRRVPCVFVGGARDIARLPMCRRPFAPGRTSTAPPPVPSRVSGAAPRRKLPVAATGRPSCAIQTSSRLPAPHPPTRAAHPGLSAVRISARRMIAGLREKRPARRELPVSRCGRSRQCSFPYSAFACRAHGAALELRGGARGERAGAGDRDSARPARLIATSREK